MGERHPPDPGISDVEAMIQTSIEMQTDALHRSAPPEQAAGPRPGLRLRREVQHGMAPQEDPSSAAEERSLGAGHEGHVVIPVAPDDFADRPEPRRCLVADPWAQELEACREIREVLRPDAEAPSRARARCNWEQLHEMPAPERKEITMELKPQIIGEEVPLSALEDLPNQTEGPEVIQEEKEEEKRPAASTAPDKKSILSLLRGCARSIMNSPGFEPVVLFVIVISSVSLAFENPFQDPNSEVTFLQDVIDKFSVGVITLEMIVRMLVMGLWKRPSDCEPGELPGYFRVPWHVLDFVICLGGLTYVLAEFFTTNLNDLKSIRVLKMVSMLRPLRLIGKTSSVRLIIEALLAAIPTLINMSLMSAMFFLGFSLLFVGFFKGALPDIVTRKDCLKAGGEWINSQSHFDRVTDSLVALMHIGSGEGWIDVTLNIISAQGIDLQPRPKTRLEQAIPVVIFMALTNFFLM
eukprot:g20596.t1